MDKDEFLKKFYELRGLTCNEHLLERDVTIVITKSSYGYPTTAILEINGSPPKLRIVADVYNITSDKKNFDAYDLASNLFVINHKALTPRAKNRKEMLSLFFRFLQSNGYLEPSHKEGNN